MENSTPNAKTAEPNFFKITFKMAAKVMFKQQPAILNFYLNRI